MEIESHKFFLCDNNFIGEVPRLRDDNAYEHRPLACAPSGFATRCIASTKRAIYSRDQRSVTPPGAQTASLCSVVGFSPRPRSLPARKSLTRI